MVAALRVMRRAVFLFLNIPSFWKFDNK